MHPKLWIPGRSQAVNLSIWKGTDALRANWSLGVETWIDGERRFAVEDRGPLALDIPIDSAEAAWLAYRAIVSQRLLL